MFTSFDEDIFRQAIKDKDYLCLKVNTVSSMLDDPTFERGETMKVLKILEEQVPEIFEEYTKLDYEERLERDAWDKRYFTKLTYWFQENFAKERIAYITEVGNVVHRDTAEKYAESYSMQSKPVNIPAQAKAVQSPNTQPKPSTKVTPKMPQGSYVNRTIQPKKAASTSTEKLTEKKTRNFPTAGVILTVGALVFVGVLLLKFLVK